jgi:hypothetical protein
LVVSSGFNTLPLPKGEGLKTASRETYSTNNYPLTTN